MAKTVFDMGRKSISISAPSWAEFIPPKEIQDIERKIRRHQLRMLGLIVYCQILESMPDDIIIFKGGTKWSVIQVLKRIKKLRQKDC